MKSPLETLDAHIEEVNQDRSRVGDVRNAAERDLMRIDAELRGLMWARSALVGEGGNGAQPPAAKTKAKAGACTAEIVRLLKGSLASSLADIEFGCPAFTPEQIRPVLRKMVAGGDIVETDGKYRLPSAEPQSAARAQESLV